mgnify:FL=1
MLIKIFPTVLTLVLITSLEFSFAHDLRDPAVGCIDEFQGDIIENSNPGCDEDTNIHNWESWRLCTANPRRNINSCLTFDTFAYHLECQDCVASGSGGNSNKDMSGYNGDGSDFNGPGQKWTNMDWSNTSLKNTNFGGGTFRLGTTYAGADLTGASFQGTKWTAEIDFQNANLTDVSFAEAMFEKIPNFEEAETLKGATFNNVVVDWKTFQILQNKKADLSGIKLRESTSIIKKSDTDWDYDSTQPIQFNQINDKLLQSLDLSNVNVVGANFDNLNLVDLGIIFSNTGAVGSSFIGTTLGQSHFDDLTGGKNQVFLDGAILKKLNIKGGTISYKNAEISDSKIIAGYDTFQLDEATTMDNITIAEPSSTRARPIGSLLFSKILNSHDNPVTYSYLNFEEGAVIQDIFSNSEGASQVTFENVDFFNVTLENVNFQEASFNKSEIKCSILNNVNLTNVTLMSTPIKFVRWCESIDMNGNPRTDQCDMGMPDGSSC